MKASRRPLTGSKDEGDVLVNLDNGDSLTIEVKAGKQTANPNRTQLEEWWRQAKVEGKNSGMPYALCVVRYRRKLEDADVYFLWCQKKAHMYLDEYCRFLKTMGPHADIKEDPNY